MKDFVKILILLLSFSAVLLGCNKSELNTTTEVMELPTEVEKIKVPDVSKVDVDSAKIVLSQLGLLPIIEYQYSNNIEKGCAVKTYPARDSLIEKGSRITLYVSKGPSKISSKDSTIQWYSIDYTKRDEWEFYNPFIEDDYLYIYCKVVFGVDFSFKDTGFGDASLTDTFDKQVPLRLYDFSMKSLENNMKVEAGKETQFIISVPVNLLDSEKPTHLSCSIVYIRDGEENDIRVSFNMSW